MGNTGVIGKDGGIEKSDSDEDDDDEEESSVDGMRTRGAKLRNRK